MLAEEITAKKLKLKEAGEQISDNLFEEERRTFANTSTQTEEYNYLLSLAPPQQPFQAMGKDEFRSDDNKVKFYTGLPSFDILHAVFRRIAPFVTRKSQLLMPFQEYVLILTKLRLN